MLVKDAAICRPDQLFGVWAIEETRFRRMVDLARGADLAALRAESEKNAEEAKGRPLYLTTPEGIAVVEISGPMTKYPTSFQALLGGTATLRTREALRAAQRDPEVLGIMLVVDSPGGTIAGTADLAGDVRRIAAMKPLYAYAADFAASAALWAMSGARHVYANQSAEIGSIGVYSVVEDTSGMYAQEGVKVHVISSAPPIKGAGIDGSPITEPQLAEWKRRVDDMADVFVTELAGGRRLEKKRAQELATGQMWVAEKARQLGLIDGVMSLDEAMARLRSEAMAEQETQAALAMAAEAEAAAEKELAARKELEKRVAELQTKLDANQGQLAALEREKRAARFAEEAKLLQLPADAAAWLEKIEAAAGGEAYAAMVSAFKAKAAQADASKLFGEIGTSGAAQSDGAWGQIEALAQGRVAKGEFKTMPEAVAAVCSDRPDLYKLHREAEGKGVH